MRTIQVASTQLRQADQVIQAEFIPSITGGITRSKDERKILSLPPKLGGLDIPIFVESFQVEYEKSVQLTERICSKIINHTRQHEADYKSLAIKNEIRSATTDKIKSGCKISGIT